MAVTATLRARTVATFALTVTTSLAAALVSVTPAQAEVVEPPRPAFYEAPATLPAANGALIRSEHMTFLLDPLDSTSLVRNASRIMYKTTNRTGKSIAVTGTVLVPKSAWSGPGTRPVIGYAAGTQGMADRCAPSRQFSEGIEYEGVIMDALLQKGYAIAMTDYEGLGTAGIHTYMDRLSQGHAVLDAVKAAQQLAGSGLTPSSPVGLEGYSQGGGAAASAVELAPTYAPGLNLKGAFLGAVPADLKAVANNLDGSLYAAFGFFAVRGLSASYGLDPYLSSLLNEDGLQALEDIEQDCVFDLFSSSFKKSEDLTIDGRPLSALMEEEPFAFMVENQRIGTIKPTVPVYVNHSMLDDVIPYKVGKAMAKSWCNQGANVRFDSNFWPTHIGGMAGHASDQVSFWNARFSGKRQWSNCWIL